MLHRKETRNIISYRYRTKYLQSDWRKRVQYRPCCTLSLKTILFDKTRRAAFDFLERMEIH